MKIPILLLSLTLVVLPHFFHADPHLMLNYQRTDNPSRPSNYTLQTTFKTMAPPSFIIYSPDNNWMVYTSDLKTNSIFFRNRAMLNSESQAKLDESQGSPYIQSFAFNPQGDLLFVGTQDHIFVCKFSPTMRDKDCLKSQFVENAKYIPMIKTNSANKFFALVAYDEEIEEIWVFSFTSEGDLTLENNIFLDAMRCMAWHPKAQKDLIIIGGNRNYQTGGGYIAIYNITSKSMNVANTTERIVSFSILNDGQTMLVEQFYLHEQRFRLAQYNLSMTSANKVGIIINQSFQVIQTSLDGKLVAGLLIDSSISNQKQVVVVYFVTVTDQLTSYRIGDKRTAASTIDMTELYRIDCSLGYPMSISTDINDILLYSPYSHYQILQYSLCLNNTYFNNLLCLNCSNICKTCHINSHLCFECIDNTYALTNGSCILCSSTLVGCETCLNSSYCLRCIGNTFLIKNGSCLQCNSLMTGCLSCSSSSQCLECIDKTFALKNGSCLKCKSMLPGCLTCQNSSYCRECDSASGYEKYPSNGVCQCYDFYYGQSGECKPCDSQSICRKCLSQKFCLTCNERTNWQQTPLNGTCVCQDYFYNNSGVCSLCDSLKTCTKCENPSQCTKCDTSKGFSQTPVNGSCACPKTFTLYGGNCISCQIQGCIGCHTDNVCYQCNQNLKISEGKCIDQMLFIYIGIGAGIIIVLVGTFLYCRWKKSKKKNSEESLIGSVEEEDTITRATIKSQKSEYSSNSITEK